MKDDLEKFHITVEIGMSEIQYEPDGNVKDMDGGYSTTIKTIHTNDFIKGLDVHFDPNDRNEKLSEESKTLLIEMVQVLQEESLYGSNIHRVRVFVDT